MKIAIAGNPNSGKTTLFNALTGLNQFVGNWPGVTVEKKEGRLKGKKNVHIMDLPGIYSLSPYSLEEIIARDYLVNERPDVIINIIDGTNLERSLYLTTQIAELGIPMVIAVNMMDSVDKAGDKLDTKKLSEQLGYPVVGISALKRRNIQQLIKETLKAGEDKGTVPVMKFNSVAEETITGIKEIVGNKADGINDRWLAVKFFERDEKVSDTYKLNKSETETVEKYIKKCEEKLDDSSESIIANERYKYAAKVASSSFVKKDKGALTVTDKIDKVVTNRFLALPIFVVVMFIVYFVSVTTVGAIVTDWTNEVLFAELIAPGVEDWLVSINTADWLTGLIVDGIIGGVGAVLGFVPQMFVLFLFLALLEACGYMARIAFILDRLFRKFGLSGKSFIPMLIGTGCSVPGIMASRTIENERDRKMTIITSIFMPCGAKLPIIALIAGALFNEAWWVAPSAYFMGIAAVIISGIMLKKTKPFAGDPSPFVMELPAYRWPTVGNVLKSMWERGWSFIKKAGTVVLLSSIFIWFTSSFGIIEGKFTMVEDLSDGFLSKIGTALAWIFKPLGFGEWRLTVATIMGLVAKENVVSTIGILYGFAEVSESGEEIWELLAASYTQIAAYSYLAFNLLCAPCFAAIGATKREMNSGKWTWFAVGYQTVFAYAVALIIYQIGTLLSTGAFGLWTVISFVVLGIMLYLLFRPQPKRSLTGERITA